MSDAAECHVAPDVCARNTPSTDSDDAPIDPNDPAVPPRLVALVAGAMTLRRDHETLVKLVANCPLPEASAVARLALILSPEPAQVLFQRIARYILRMEAEAPR